MTTSTSPSTQRQDPRSPAHEASPRRPPRRPPPHRHQRRLRRRRVRSLRHPLRHGELVNSCLIPALQANNATITTIEGLSPQPEPATDPLLPIPYSLLPCPPPHPAMLPRTRRSPMRHLHPRHDPRHPPPLNPTPQPHRSPNPRRPLRQPLPLHRLHAHLRLRPTSRPRVPSPSITDH